MHLESFFEPRRTRRFLFNNMLFSSCSSCPSWFILLFVCASFGCAAEEDFFSQRIAPLLSEKCLSCHHPQKKEGELDLSTRELALKGGENGPAFVNALEARGILVDQRPGAGIRVSPHYYTLEDEMDEFVEAMVELRRKQKWREHAGASTAY